MHQDTQCLHQPSHKSRDTAAPWQHHPYTFFFICIYNMWHCKGCSCCSLRIRIKLSGQALTRAEPGPLPCTLSRHMELGMGQLDSLDCPRLVGRCHKSIGPQNLLFSLHLSCMPPPSWAQWCVVLQFLDFSFYFT